MNNSETSLPTSLPRRVTIQELTSARYPSGDRPSDWAKRVEGVDQILTTSGETLSLWSDGQQSPPQPGWTVLLTHTTSSTESGPTYGWTLYGIAGETPVAESS